MDTRLIPFWPHLTTEGWRRAREESLRVFDWNKTTPNTPEPDNNLPETESRIE